MLSEITKLWFDARPGVIQQLQNTEIEHIDTYNKLLYIILTEFNKVVDADETKYDWDKFKLDIKQIDYGDYQGTLILTFAKDIYQPSASDTYYTYVEYGSCSGCDTLMNIIYSNPFCYDNYDDLTDDDKEEYNKAKEHQINDLLTLCLHMIERTALFADADIYN